MASATRRCEHDDDDAIVVSMESKPPKLLDRVRAAIRMRHYSRRTEDAYTHWIRAYILFHRMTHPASLGADDVSAFHLLVTLLYGAGLRLEECLALRIKDIDLDRDQIIVRQGKGRKDRAQESGGRNGLELAVRLSGGAPVSRSAVRAAVAVSPARVGGAEGGGAGGACGGDSQTGRPAHAAALLCDASAGAGHDIRTVQELLGHRDVRTTMTYLHVMQKGALGVKSPVDRL